MRLYSGSTIDDVWDVALRDLLEADGSIGSRDGACSETLGATFVLDSVNHNVLLNPIRRLSVTYAAAELLWYLSGNAETKMIEAYAPSYARYAEHGVAHGAYGYRFRGTRYHDPDAGEADRSFRTICGRLAVDGKEDRSTVSQLSAVIRLLRERPLSRQAVIQLWRDADLAHAIIGDHADLPCTLSVQFHLRHDRLHAHVYMRSNDIWLGTPYDIFCWSSIQRIIADELGVQPGTYTHTVGSLHLYHRNRERAWIASANGVPVWANSLSMRTAHDYQLGSIGHIGYALRVEEAIRNGHEWPDVDVEIPGHTVIWDALILVVSRWNPNYIAGISSPLIRQALEGVKNESVGSSITG